MSNGEKIELTDSLKAYMEAEDLVLVNRSKFRMANEARLYFEVLMAISLCFLGVTIAEFQLWTFIIFGISGLLAVFFIIRTFKHSKIGKLIELKGIFRIGEKETQ